MRTTKLPPKFADPATYYKPRTMEKPVFEVSARLMTYLQSMR